MLDIHRPLSRSKPELVFKQQQWFCYRHILEINMVLLPSQAL